MVPNWYAPSWPSAVGWASATFAFGGSASSGSGAVSSGKTTVSKSDLDATMATYTTRRDVQGHRARRHQQHVLAQRAEAGDGTYKIASRTASLRAPRCVEQTAKEKGASTVSAKEMKSYAESTFGSSDYATIASNYGMQSKSTVKKLHQAVPPSHAEAAQQGLPSRPSRPQQPPRRRPSPRRQHQTASADYAKYIINLADEWDLKGTWSGKGSTRETALKSYTITSTSRHLRGRAGRLLRRVPAVLDQQTKMETEWTNYVNKLPLQRPGEQRVSPVPLQGRRRTCGAKEHAPSSRGPRKFPGPSCFAQGGAADSATGIALLPEAASAEAAVFLVRTSCHNRWQTLRGGDHARHSERVPARHRMQVTGEQKPNAAMRSCAARWTWWACARSLPTRAARATTARGATAARQPRDAARRHGRDEEDTRGAAYSLPRCTRIAPLAV